MNLVYVDESGTDGKSDELVVGAVIVHDSQFGFIEWVAADAAKRLVPHLCEDENFEFHASDLLAGLGAFAAIDEPTRHEAIRGLLHLLRFCKATFVYSAVHKRTLQRSVFISAKAQDVAFNLCLGGVWDALARRALATIEGETASDAKRRRNEPYIIISDEISNREVKAALQRTFRNLRPKGYSPHAPGRLLMCHDDMYFGESKFSVGLQLADVCALLIQRKLRGEHDAMVEALLPYTECAFPPGLWEQSRDFIRAHVPIPELPTEAQMRIDREALMLALGSSDEASAPTEPDEGQP